MKAMSVVNDTSLTRASHAVPPQSWFAISSVFHYLGPAFAVLLFPAVGVLGVAWFRVTSAALIFAPITKPWRTFREAEFRARLLLLALGICLAVMNLAFYQALDRLPMSLVASMEFISVMFIALHGVRVWRNFLAFMLVIFGVVVLIDVRWQFDLVGLLWAGLNAVLFALYVVIGHKAAEGGADKGVERLGAAMAIAGLVLLPIGLLQAIDAFKSLWLVLAGVGVGISSSVVPYVCDQLAMARLPRASFALMLAMLPAMATIIAAIILAQIPTIRDLLGIALVILGVSIHIPTR